MAKENLSPTKRALLEKWLQGRLKDDVAQIPPRPKDSPLRLSFPQQRQLFLELLERGTAVNNLSAFLSIRGDLDPAVLEESADRIMARHDALRTRFVFGQGMPTPEVRTGVRVPIPLVDLRQGGLPDKAAEARRLAEEDVLQPFLLSQAPLVRLKLFRIENDVYRLLIVVHHTIADGWSLGVFLQELMAFYQEISVGSPSRLPAPSIQYADFAYWQTGVRRGELSDSAMAYWKDRLSGELPVLELPTDHPRGARQSFAGGTYRFVLPADVMDALERLSREEDATVFMALLAAFCLMLHRYSGQDEILVGTPMANRNLPELQHLIGVFINTLVLRTSLAGDPSFRDLLRRVRDVSLGAYAHQDVPFEMLVEALKPQRDLSRTPLFQVVFNLQNAPMPKLAMPGLDIGFEDLDRGVSQFDLTLMMYASGGPGRGIVEYNRDLFKPASIARMFSSFQLLLEDALTHPDDPISGFRLVADAEQRQLVESINRTARPDVPRKKCVHHLFEEQVERTPDAVALLFAQSSLTYAGLNLRANRLANHLRDLGVGPEVRVGIYMERSLAMVEALLGVLKAGGAYVPIHPSFPVERIRFMLKDAGVKVLLTNIDPLPSFGQDVHTIDMDKEIPSARDGHMNPRIDVKPEHLAYVMYTSGSTGQPKGVMVAHGALVNFLWSMRDRPGIGAHDVLLAVTALSFDIAALEVFLPLLVGAKVVVASKQMTTNPALLGEAISHFQVSVMQATPATWQVLLDSGWAGSPALKALCGGDVLTRKLADRLLGRAGSLWNMYGPTETTVWSAVSQVRHDDAPITIGQPIGNTQLYILDRYLKPLPIGVVGELYIGGEGLARGYLNLPQLTGEKFIPDRFSAEPGARLYKTGDRARYLPDGSVELLGRADDQVKLHGNRIELGEVAAVLQLHPSIREAVAIVRTETSGDKRLAAYVVPKEDTSPDASELREFLRTKLPGYMIPALFISLPRMPLSPAGKVDRKALPAPADVRPLNGYEAPRNETEKVLAAIWQDVLDIEQVGIHDNFFDLGGASLQSLEIVAKANMFGLPVSVEAIFEHQTIAELAERVHSA